MKSILCTFLVLFFALSPATAKSATVIEGDLQIYSASFDNCPVGFDCADYLPKVGSQWQFQVTFGENAPRDGEFNSIGSASGFSSGKLAFVKLIFKGGKPMGGSIFIEGSDDVCGGGAFIGFNSKSIYGRETRCGYLYGIYPFLHTSYLGKFPRVTVNGISVVPEPQTYLLFILGFGMIGVILRRRNATNLRQIMSAEAL